MVCQPQDQLSMTAGHLHAEAVPPVQAVRDELSDARPSLPSPEEPEGHKAVHTNERFIPLYPRDRPTDDTHMIFCPGSVLPDPLRAAKTVARVIAAVPWEVWGREAQ